MLHGCVQQSVGRCCWRVAAARQLVAALQQRTDDLEALLGCLQPLCGAAAGAQPLPQPLVDRALALMLRVPDESASDCLGGGTYAACRGGSGPVESMNGGSSTGSEGSGQPPPHVALQEPDAGSAVVCSGSPANPTSLQAQQQQQRRLPQQQQLRGMDLAQQQRRLEDILKVEEGEEELLFDA